MKVIWSFALLSLSSLAHAGVVQNGTFAMLSGGACDDQAQNCYLDNPDIAESVVGRLAAIGVTRFLVPSATLEELRTIASPIKARGLEFYTYERWAFESATKGGQFDCGRYTSERVNPVIVRLKAEFGSSFAGLHFKDEPPEADITPLAQMSKCIKADERLAGLKIFINLFPLHVNSASYAGSPNGGAMVPIEYGVDCGSSRIVYPERTAQMVARYSAFAQRVSDEIAPDQLSFDLYPFTPSLRNCPTARDLLLSENMSIISNLGKSRNQEPIAYLQNVQSAYPALSQDPFEYASFHELRWFAGWSFAFGIRGFSNFITHDVGSHSGVPSGSDMLGMFDKNNAPRHLASDQQSAFGVTAQVQEAIKDVEHLGFADNSLGVPSARISGWLSNESFLLGEYGNADLSHAYIVVAARAPRQPASGVIGLKQWWHGIEKLDFESGVWHRVGTSTNRIDVQIGLMPLELYRLSR